MTTTKTSNALICDHCGSGAFFVIVSRYNDDILEKITCVRCGKTRHIETGVLYPN